jgi:hypothetical protein
MTGLDWSTIECRPQGGANWLCWSNQTCGQLYDCIGEARDAPNFQAAYLPWVIIGFVLLAIAIIIAIIGALFAVSYFRGKKWCEEEEEETPFPNLAEPESPEPD